MGKEIKTNDFIELLQNETDRGAALLGYGLFEHLLLKIIEAFIIERKQSKEIKYVLRSFHSRLEIAYALGLVDDTEYSNIKVLKDIRNKFAHGFNPNLSFNDGAIIELCKKLIKYHQLPEKFKPEKDPRFFFNLTVSRLLIEMYSREKQIETERIVYKDRVLRIQDIPKQ
ncbi:MAG: hypothetical protein K8R63_06790 [Bacteroidales bacterium]|nr:hypothetical protein [Bacteroidales bacterium]